MYSAAEPFIPCASGLANADIARSLLWSEHTDRTDQREVYSANDAWNERESDTCHGQVCQQLRGLPTRKTRSTTAKPGRAIGRQSCGSMAVEDKRAVGPRGQSTQRLRSKQLNRFCTLLLGPVSLVPPAWQTQTLRQACCGANVPINAKYTRQTKQ